MKYSGFFAQPGSFQAAYQSFGVHRRAALLLSILSLVLLSGSGALAQPAENLDVSPPPGGLLLTQPQVDLRPQVNLGIPEFPDINVNPTPTAAVTQVVRADENDRDGPLLTLTIFALIASVGILSACVAMILTMGRGAL